MGHEENEGDVRGRVHLYHHKIHLHVLSDS